MAAASRLVSAGILLSLAGDVALLSRNDNAFQVGLVAFLIAHVLYTVANLGVAAWPGWIAAIAVAVVAATFVLLRFVRPADEVLDRADAVRRAHDRHLVRERFDPV